MSVIVDPFEASRTSESVESESSGDSGDSGVSEASETSAVSASDSLLEMDESSLREALISTRDRMMRYAAEVENQRRRLERERDEASRYGASSLARDVLDVADGLSRAASETESDSGSLLEGIRMLDRAFHLALERHGVVRFGSSGDVFDPRFHQALAEVPDSDAPSGRTIREVARVGYMLGDRVLRPAEVVVSFGGLSEASDSSDASGVSDAEGSSSGGGSGGAGAVD